MIVNKGEKKQRGERKSKRTSLIKTNKRPLNLNGFMWIISSKSVTHNFQYHKRKLWNEVLLSGVLVTRLIVASPSIKIICICGSGYVKSTEKLLLRINYNKKKRTKTGHFETEKNKLKLECFLRRWLSPVTATFGSILFFCCCPKDLIVRKHS